MKKKIILVDDDPSILESLQIVLEYEGYGVTVADSGADLKKIIKKQVPDIFILDYQLPRENGTQITKYLKKNTTTKHIPIIIISANHKVEVEVEEAGANDFLEKPFDIDAFLEKVKKYT